MRSTLTAIALALGTTNAIAQSLPMPTFNPYNSKFEMGVPGASSQYNPFTEKIETPHPVDLTRIFLVLFHRGTSELHIRFPVHGTWLSGNRLLVREEPAS